MRSESGIEVGTDAPSRMLRVGTWNLNHWRQTVAEREQAWAKLAGWKLDVALLQETVPSLAWPRERVVYRPIAETRAWGSAVVSLAPDIEVREIDAVRTRYSTRLFSMLGTFPGAVIVARAVLPELGTVTCVSVYGVTNVYAQTTMLRVVADLIPLFDSVDGQNVILGGDFNVGTSGPKDAPEYARYEAILRAIESLGLKNVAAEAKERPPRPADCQCGDPDCRHLWTYRTGQLDHLYATPGLASQCRRLWVPAHEASGLSDHAPIMAEFELARPLKRTELDADSFVEFLGQRHGDSIRRVAEEVLTWADRKQVELAYGPYADARLDRLPCRLDHGESKLWIQLDRDNQVPFQWLCALRGDANIELQFQYMTGYFAGETARRELWERITAIPGVRVDARLSGRPIFPMAILTHRERLDMFTRVLDHVVDRSLGSETSGDVARVEATGPPHSTGELSDD
jgi:exonuclease III